MIQLIGINSKYIHSCLAVHALSDSIARLSEFYRISLPEVKVSEYTINDPYDSLLSSILYEKADIIAFSVYIWNVRRVMDLCSDIKAARPETVIILGGPEVSYGIEEKYAVNWDYVISGEGEYSLFALLAKLCGYDTDVPVKCLSGDEIPFPYNDSNIDLFKNRIVYYEASRGCPFSCAYCLSGKEDRLRLRSIGNVKKHIDFFIRHRVPMVKFTDRTFNADKKRAAEIFRYICENAPHKGMTFHFECGGDLFDEPQFEALKSAPKGLFHLEIGVQSTMKEALTASARYADNETVFEAIRKLKSFGNIAVHADLIAGLPFESYERFSESFNDIYALGADELQLGFLKILKGAPLNDKKEEYGYVFSENPPYEIIKNKWLNTDDIIALKETEDALDRYYNSGRFSETLRCLTGKIPSPFAFYRELGAFFRKKNLIGRGISSLAQFDMLYEFVSSLGYINVSEEELVNHMLFDFYCSDPSEIVPSSLKKYHKTDKVIRRMLDEKGENSFHGAGSLRMIGDILYVFDYSRREDGRCYSYARINIGYWE